MTRHEFEAERLRVRALANLSPPPALRVEAGSLNQSWREVDVAVHGFWAEDENGNRIDPANISTSEPEGER